MKIFKIYTPENAISPANTLLTRVKDPLGFCAKCIRGYRRVFTRIKTFSNLTNNLIGIPLGDEFSE